MREKKKKFMQMCRLSRQRINREISSGSGLILIGTKEQKKRKRERER